jgi:6,7-dimethyl-8-ribityllumazine synthase
MLAPMADARVIEGALDATGLRVALVVARFNSFVTERLLEGAVDALVRCGASRSDLVVVRVPGAWELPLVCARAAASGRHDAVVALGCLMRGDTIHFDLIAGEAVRGLGAASRETGVPVAFGVLTTDSLEQAIDRAGGKGGNKGAEAALAAVEQARVLQGLASPGRGRARSGGR